MERQRVKLTLEKAVLKAYTQKKACNHLWMTPSHRFTRFWALKGRKGGSNYDQPTLSPNTICPCSDTKVQFNKGMLICVVIVSVGQLVSTSFQTITVPENPSTKWTKKEIELWEKLPDFLYQWIFSSEQCECCFCELWFWDWKNLWKIRVEFQIFIFLHMFFINNF